MKKPFYIAYSALFIGICLAPAALMPFFSSNKTAEKRELTTFPKLKTEDGSLNFDYFSQFGTWFSEHIAFRSQLVTADGRLKSTLMGTSPNSDVIVGKDGWLYYGDTADDYLNINTLTPCEISNIAHNLRMIDDRCREQGAQFVFFTAPNKNSIYPEYMPFNYVPSDNDDNYAMLSSSVKQESWFLDMESALKATNSSIPLYHKTDTHWNNLGAYAGHTAVMNKLRREPCSSGTEWTTKNDRLGDLAAMIYPAEKAKDTQVYSDYEFTYKYEGRFRGFDDIIISTNCENAEGDLLMFRDSYGEAILPYMAETFAKAKFSRAVPYDVTNVTEGQTVILEIVERNLGNLQKYAPLMSAPEADISWIAAKEYDGGEQIIRSERSGSFMHIYGELPECFFSGDDHNIYVEVNGITYEAFNCFEDKLLGRLGEHNGRGFSLYITSEEEIDNIKVTVVNYDGKAVSCNE